MITKLIRLIRVSRVKILEIEKSAYDAQRAFNGWAGEVNALSSELNRAGSGVTIEIPSLNLPTREQLMVELYEILGLPNSDSQELVNWRRRRKADLDAAIGKVNSVNSWIDRKYRRPLTDVVGYIRIGLEFIRLAEIALRLLNLLLKGLRVALSLIAAVPFVPFGGFLNKLANGIAKIEGWIKQGYEAIKTFREIIERLTEKTVTFIEKIVQKFVDILTFVIKTLNDLKAFIDLITIDTLKALLGISNVSHLTVLNNYASTLDTPETPLPPASNGSTEDVNRRIGEIVDPTNPPPRYIAELTNEQLTRLQFILDEQDKIKKEDTKNYLESLSQGVSLEQLELTLDEIRRLLSLNLLVLTREDEEYLRLLEQYNLTPTPEEQPIVQLPLRPGEFERYGINRDNAVVSYERRNT
jgi:hypothetical protein